MANTELCVQSACLLAEHWSNLQHIRANVSTKSWVHDDRRKLRWASCTTQQTLMKQCNTLLAVYILDVKTPYQPASKATARAFFRLCRPISILILVTACTTVCTHSACMQTTLEHNRVGGSPCLYQPPIWCRQAGGWGWPTSPWQRG